MQNARLVYTLSLASSMQSLRSLVIEHGSAEFKDLQFDSSQGQD